MRVLSTQVALWSRSFCGPGLSPALSKFKKPSFYSHSYECVLHPRLTPWFSNPCWQQENDPCRPTKSEAEILRHSILL